MSVTPPSLPYLLPRSKAPLEGRLFFIGARQIGQGRKPGDDGKPGDGDKNLGTGSCEEIDFFGKDEFVVQTILQLDALQAIFGTWRYIFDRLQKTKIRFLHSFQTGRSLFCLRPIRGCQGGWPGLSRLFFAKAGASGRSTNDGRTQNSSCGCPRSGRFSSPGRLHFSLDAGTPKRLT
jgi:hypothetical protein